MKKEIIRNEHPAWLIHNLLRTSILSERYYEILSNRLRFYSTTMDIVIAITTPTGVISALTIWDNDIGAIIWKTFLIIAAVFSVIKPILKITDKLQIVDSCLSGYKTLTFDCNRIIDKMVIKRAFDNEILLNYDDAINRQKSIVTQEGSLRKRNKVIVRLSNAINDEFKDYDFILPEVINEK